MLTLFLTVLSLMGSADGPASAAHDLHPGEIVEREISGPHTDLYDVALAAGQCTDVLVEQKGADVYLRVLDADGKLLAEVDNELRSTGTETATIVGGSGAAVRVSVTARYPKAAAGRYAIRVAEPRTATAKDRALFDAESLITTALRLSSSGKLEEARATAERAVDAARTALGADHPNVAYALGRLANIERMLGQYAAAREKYKEAEAIDEHALGHDDPQTVILNEGIALTYISEGEYGKAQTLLEDARASTERVLGPDHPRMITRFINLGLLYQKMEDQRSAIAVLQKALAICEKSIEPGEYQFLAVVGNLGALHRDLAEYDRAAPLLERSLHMVEARFGVDHPYVAIPLQELSIIARERGQYDEAIALAWRAEAAREKALGLIHPDTVASLIVVANAYDAMGEHQRALDLHRQAMEVLEKAVGPYHELILISLANMAREYTALGDIPCALESETRMDSVIEKNLALNLAIGSERQKLGYKDTISGGRTDRTISLHVDHAPDDPRAAEHALLVLLQRKGRVLDAMSDNFAAIRRALSPADQRLLDRLRTTTADLAKVALGGPGKTPRSEYRAGLKKLEQEKEKLESAIGSRSSAFRAEHRPVTISAVRRAIPADAALVELAVYRSYDALAKGAASEFGEPHYISYVLRRSGDVRWKDLGSTKNVDRVVARWRHALADPQSSDVDTLAREVDSTVMQPLRPILGSAKRLLIAPDGQLDLVPFEALVDQQGRYLVERYAITYVGSGRDLLHMNNARPSHSAPLIIADPAFGQPAPVMIASSSPRSGAATSNDFSTVFFAPLAGTREEARSIRALFPEARLLTGARATKSALRRVDAPSILHIATHGFFLTGTRGSTPAGTRSISTGASTQNPLLRSGLALSGANLNGREDGVLTALEASTLNLGGTKLVTLSACDSGVGEVKNREGVYGLRRAFFLAGAETVVMSLWPVSDLVTRQMMTAYYSGLKRGFGRGDALRRAELVMLARPAHHHPFYWASFIQSGDWRSLNPTR